MDPPQQRGRLAAGVELEPAPLDLICGVVDITGRDRVIDRVDHQPVFGQPGAGPPMQVGDQLRREPPQLAKQQLAEEMVVPEPLVRRVQRDHEQVRALQLPQHQIALLPLRDGVAQGPRQPGQDRGVHQELAHIRAFTSTTSSHR